MSVGGTSTAAATGVQFRYEFYYYSDSTYTTMVGYEIGGCLPGEGYRDGVGSPYVLTYRERCFA